MRRAEAALLVVGAVTTAAVALAPETVTYRYDARGRLIQVERASAGSNTVVTNYSYDKADNRTGKTVAGAPS